MKVKPKKSSRKYVAAVQKLRLEIVQRKSVTNALEKSEYHYVRLLKESYRMQERLRHLSHQILLAHEEERKKISRELHDEIGQILAGISIRLATLKNETSSNTKSIKKKIASTQRLVEKSMKTIHRFARELRPAVLDDMGLIPALKIHIKDFTKRTSIPIRFKVFTFSKIEELGSVQRTAFYRVAQEALRNVDKHANASLVKMSLQKRDGTIHMEIKDNGKSFSVERMLHAGRRKRLGLLGMRERMEMIGGNFSVDSKPGKGTTVRVYAPLKISNGGRGGGEPNQPRKGFL
ncbi:MAG: sensor histidine kinase [Candidatus Omnitrophica bacterium]|nr:sensor histidine kinase [Candidatus Omnitrophota bacterium]